MLNFINHRLLIIKIILLLVAMFHLAEPSYKLFVYWSQRDLRYLMQLHQVMDIVK